MKKRQSFPPAPSGFCSDRMDFLEPKTICRTVSKQPCWLRPCHLSDQTQAAFVLRHFILTVAFTCKIATTCVSPPPRNYPGRIHTVQLRVGQGHLSIWAPRGSRSDTYSSPAPLHAKVASAAAGFGMGPLHGRWPSLPRRRAAKGRQSSSPGLRAELLVPLCPHTTASLPPLGLGGARRCWPLLAPCTSTWCPLASHGPGGAGPFAMGLARGDRAACHHHGS